MPPTSRHLGARPQAHFPQSALLVDSILDQILRTLQNSNYFGVLAVFHSGPDPHRQECQTAQLEAVSVGAHTTVITASLSTQFTEIVLGFHDAKLFQSLQQFVVNL
jgi:hypothetical protein